MKTEKEINARKKISKERKLQTVSVQLKKTDVKFLKEVAKIRTVRKQEYISVAKVIREILEEHLKDNSLYFQD